MAQNLFDGIFSGTTGIAATLLDLMGTEATLTHTVDGLYDAANDTELPPAITVDTVDASPPAPYKVDQIDGSSVRREDRWSMVPQTMVTQEIVPNKATLTVNGKVWQVVAIDPTETGELTAMFMLQLRI